jgi:hypothetical protein
MLEDASIKLSSVASSLTTASARAMLTALIAGNRTLGCWPRWPMASCRIKISLPAETLTGHFNTDHA